jgi:hypothetical protein
MNKTIKSIVIFIIVLYAGVSFIHMKKKIQDQKVDIKAKEALIQDQHRMLTDIQTEMSHIDFPKITMTASHEKMTSVKGKSFKLNRFKLPIVFNKTIHLGVSSGWFASLDKHLLLAMPDGTIYQFNADDLRRDNLTLNLLPSNIKTFVNWGELNAHTKAFNPFGLRDIKIIRHKIYVSYTNEEKKDCFNTAILVADLNETALTFKPLFKVAECADASHDFSAHQSGGKIADFKDGKILFTHGDYVKKDSAQDDKSIFGKVLAINLKDGSYEIISKGHRTDNGIFYDKTQDVIVMTEHGPKGGDEININDLKNSSGVKNYGWPIASYGEEYTHKDDAPLQYKKSHKDFGFIEPIRYYVPSIGISQLVEANSNNHAHVFYVGSMGLNPDNSIHILKLNEGYTKVLDEDVLKISNRVRDIIKIKDGFLVYGESDGSLIYLH